MIRWQAHGFDDSFGPDYVQRTFDVGGVPYVIAFTRLRTLAEIQDWIPGIIKHQAGFTSVPSNGVWCVIFDKITPDWNNNFQHVTALTGLQAAKVIRTVAHALYDRYNVCKSALYVWAAAKDTAKRRKKDLTELYDTLLGLGHQSAMVKQIPLAIKLNKLCTDRRGYAIITSYI